MEEILQILKIIQIVVITIAVPAGLYYTIKQFRLIRASHYIERFNSTSMLSVHNTVDKFIMDISALDKAEQYELARRIRTSKNPKDIEIRNSIGIVINLLTELGIAYRRRAVDRKALAAFDYIIPTYWEKLEPYITVSQDLAKPRKLYNSFGYLAKELNRKQPMKDKT